MNKRQKKKRNKNWAKSVIIPFYKENEDSTMNGLMYSYKNEKILKAFTLKNVRITSVGNSHLTEPNVLNDVNINFAGNRPCIISTQAIINKLIPVANNSFKDKILSEINPQIWEYGGIKRLEYLFFRYCVQWYTFHYKDWTDFTVYDLAEQYIELYPRNNMKQLLYYIQKWQKLNIVSNTLLPYGLIGNGVYTHMVLCYKRIWHSIIDIPTEIKIREYEILFRPQE